jgi:hypothetical protein
MGAAIATATRGLLSFRLGQPLEGREKYASAVEALGSLKQYEAAALAALYWAEEELLSNSIGFVDGAARRASDMAKLAPTPAVRLRIQKLLERAQQWDRNKVELSGSFHPKSEPLAQDEL